MGHRPFGWIGLSVLFHCASLYHLYQMKKRFISGISKSLGVSRPSSDLTSRTADSVSTVPLQLAGVNAVKFPKNVIFACQS